MTSTSPNRLLIIDDHDGAHHRLVHELRYLRQAALWWHRHRHLPGGILGLHVDLLAWLWCLKLRPNFQVS